MKVPLSWLREYVPLELPPDELAHRLTMAGLEASYVPGAGAGWENVFVGRVTEVRPHPNADRLRLATVDLGDETLTIVCGAPNLAEGQKVALARVGAKLMDPRTGERSELTAATVRGVESQGMACSERELGLGDGHSGIVELPEDAPIGQPLASYLPSDDLLELEVTANRGDLLSVLGVAHEVAALTGAQVTEPSLDYPAEGPEVDSLASVRIEAPELCSRYTATVVQGIRIGPSPQWMQQRLNAAGLRPINNVVDVTNYVMLEYGQPLHAFDLAELRQATVVVRTAAEGERFRTLDGQEHELQSPMLLIADPERAIGLAGVMGGANSAMTDATTDVLLESATFNPINTRLTATALRLRSEASLRFEKGLNPELAMRAVCRATALILETAEGSAAKGVVDAFPGDAQQEPMRFTHRRLRQSLGVDFPHERVAQVLASLGFHCDVDAASAEALRVTPPYWRTDVALEDDLVEEVARIIGYDAVSDEPLSGVLPSYAPQPARELRERVKRLLVAAGLQETISYTLVSQSTLEHASAMGPGKPSPLKLANPMNREQEYLRTTLRGSLLKTLAAGLRHTSSGLRLFEAGRVYLRRPGDLPDEREMAVGVIAGHRSEPLWGQSTGPADFYEAKGIVQQMVAQLGASPSFDMTEDELLHPGRTARVLANGQPVGVVGQLHPSVVQQFDLDAPVVAFFELDLGSLLAQLPSERHAYHPFSRFPAADRDLAILVDESVPAGQLREILEDHPLVVRADLFDLFTGSPLPPGKKSLAYRLELQSDAGTLSTEQVNEVVAAQVDRLHRDTGAVLRAQEGS